jgi:response regulator RpfG family c-di-GMP phosphodiesterase
MVCGEVIGADYSISTCKLKARKPAASFRGNDGFVVDISPFFLSLERQFLRHTPAALLEAKSAGEALALARSHRPSLVSMDIDMPETDGVTWLSISVNKTLMQKTKARPQK